MIPHNVEWENLKEIRKSVLISGQRSDTTGRSNRYVLWTYKSQSKIQGEKLYTTDRKESATYVRGSL